MVRWPNPKNISLSRMKAARLAAAKARHKPSDKKRTAWEFGELYWGRFATLAINGVAILAAVFILYILWESITQKVISIAPISVPQDLTAKGYTADVAAERLQDALNDIVSRAHSLRGGPEVARQMDLPNIVVPSTSLSTEALAAQIRRFFRTESRRSVSGEITIVEKKLWLRLRMNTRDLYTSPTGGDLEHPDYLFAEAAQRIFDEADPYILAVFLSTTDPRKCLEIAKRIISDRPETDPSVPWAYNMAGKILLDQHKTGEAVTALGNAIGLNPLIAVAHGNLGIALSRLGRADDAIAEYRKAIAAFRKAVQLDPRDANLHFALGRSLFFEGEVDEAITEYRNAIDLAPRFAESHSALGDALLKQGKIGEAITEYQKAIELEPRYMDARNRLGNALRDQGKISQAIAEYQKAIDLDPRDPDAHIMLGDTLRELAITTRDPHKTKDAIAEYRKAIDLDPRDATAHNNLGIALYERKNTGDTDEAIAEFRKAIELDPNVALAHRRLSIALRQQGKNEAADAEEKKGLDLEQKH